MQIPNLHDTIFLMKKKHYFLFVRETHYVYQKGGYNNMNYE